MYAADILREITTAQALLPRLTTYCGEVLRSLRKGTAELQDTHYTVDGLAAYVVCPEDGRRYQVLIRACEPSRQHLADTAEG